jgi:hypothetical protein
MNKVRLYLLIAPRAGRGNRNHADSYRSQPSCLHHSCSPPLKDKQKKRREKNTFEQNFRLSQTTLKNRFNDEINVESTETLNEVEKRRIQTK